MDHENRKVVSDETTLLPISVDFQGIVYQDRFKKIEQFNAQFEGFSKEYFVSNYGDKAAVLIARGEDILLVRQYRLLVNGLSYEIPGGKVDDKESPSAAAQRECIEETGIRCANLKPLITFNPDLEYTKNLTHVFYAEADEDISDGNPGRFIWKPLETCLDMIFNGVISDSLSIISILAYYRKRRHA